MASLLISAPPDSFVSLEKIDDVALEEAGGQIRAVQSKDCEATNPVCNRSVQMWKTFANWTREVTSRRLDASRTIFELYVSRKVNGSLVTFFHSANTKPSAGAAFEEARMLLWGPYPKFPKRKNVAASLAPHLDEVFGNSPQAFQSIIERFQFNCAVKNPESDLHSLVKGKMAFEDEAIVTEVTVQIYGWVKKLVTEQLRQRKSPTIAQADFWQHLTASYARLRPGGALPDLGGSGPGPSEITKLLCEQFVIQMNIIDAEEETRSRAITCLFKARTARTKWSAQGKALVHEEDVKEFEDGLKHAWRNLKIEIFSDPSRTDEKLRGRLLLAKCEGHKCQVEQKQAPEYFIPGCFHDLANNKTVGWHPRFEEILTAQQP